MPAMQLGPDFATFWMAHQVSEPYGLEISRRLASPVPAVLFAYPPTFLLLTLPLALVPYFPGYVAWVAASGAALGAVARAPLALLLLISPAVVFAGLSGQTSIFAGAAVLGALMALDRPRLSGALMALALCIKPQLAMLVPVGLLMAAQWRVVAWTAVGAIALCAAATAAFGPMIWGDWLTALPAFMRVNETDLHAKELAPWPDWAKIAALSAGLVASWQAMKGDDPAGKSLAAISTALLASPHALSYDYAALAPALLSVALKRDWRMLPAAACLALAGSGLTLVLSMLLGAFPRLPHWLTRPKVLTREGREYRRQQRL